MMAEIKTPAGTGLPTEPRPSLTRVLQDISASLGDLQIAVREAEFQDEKDRAAAESGMVAADRGYQDLFDLAPDAYLVTDAQTIIAESNQAAVAMLKVDRRFLKGKPLTDFVAEADRPAFQAILIQVRGGREKRLGEFRLQPGEGAPFAVSVNVSAQTDHQDHLVRMLWLLRDVREGGGRATEIAAQWAQEQFSRHR
jgi:PAS domain S-box-containing protein